MTEPVMYLSPEGMMGAGMIPPRMIQDLLGVASIDLSQIERLSAAILSENGFLEDDRLQQIVDQHIPDATLAEAVTNSLHNLSFGIANQVISMVGAWREITPVNKERFPDEAFTRLQENLPSLIKKYPSLLRKRKADRLRGVIGNELQSIDFICDARPVFDSKRKQIEGLLTLTTLKLTYQRQNGMNDSFEVILTSDELQQLIDKAENAKGKVAIIETSFGRLNSSAKE